MTIRKAEKRYRETFDPTKHRRAQPSSWDARRRSDKCRCGCLETVTGNAVYFSSACRKRQQRILDKLERVKRPR